MDTYIRFTDGVQVEAITAGGKPGGKNWVKAPKSFDWSKRYQIESGKVKEVSQSLLDDEALVAAKEGIKMEVNRILDDYRLQVSGITYMKSNARDIQYRAAQGFLENPDNSNTAIIEALAKVRNITPEEMATLILKKADEAAQRIAKIEVLEDEADQFIADSTNLDDLNEMFGTWKIIVVQTLDQKSDKS